MLKTMLANPRTPNELDFRPEAERRYGEYGTVSNRTESQGNLP